MGNVTIVMYHYVRDLKNSRYPHIKGLSDTDFLRQIEYIMAHYTVISMEQLIEAYTRRDFTNLPQNAILLTFDDGYMDHYTVVYPVLKQYGIQGSFFPNAMAVREHKLLTVNRIHFILAAAEAMPGGIRRLVNDCFSLLDRLRAKGAALEKNDELYNRIAIPGRWDPAEVIFIKRLLQNELPEEVRTDLAKELFARYVGVPEDVFARELYMNMDQIRCMKEGGMFFGIHGYDHYWLGKLPKEQMKQDIHSALAYFDGIVDRNQWVMNYPYGNYNTDVIQYIQSIGCCLGLSVEARVAEPEKENRFLLPRLDTNDLYPKGSRG